MVWSAVAAPLQTTDRQQFGCVIPQTGNYSLALLRMGKKLPETCWADWKINKLLLSHLVGPLLYLYRWCVVKHTSNLNLKCFLIFTWEGLLELFVHCNESSELIVEIWIRGVAIKKPDCFCYSFPATSMTKRRVGHWPVDFPLPSHKGSFTRIG